MARRRSALPVISEPTLDPEHLAALLEEEQSRRRSTNSIPSREVSEANLICMYMCFYVVYCTRRSRYTKRMLKN